MTPYKNKIGLTNLPQHLLPTLLMNYQGVRINICLMPEFYCSIDVYQLFYYISFSFNLVCDTGVSIPNKPQTNQSKNSLYECLVCNVPCNSEFMYEQHVQGAKHRKKVNSGEVNILCAWIEYKKFKVNMTVTFTLFIF